MPGWDEFFREFSDRLARHGYTVICPDLYCRYGHGTPDDIAAKVRADGGVPDESVVGDLRGRQGMAARPVRRSNGKVGILGTCSGGRDAPLTASTRSAGFDAVVDLWGGGVIMGADGAQPGAVRCRRSSTPPTWNTPLLGIFGNDDRYPTPELVDQHEAELKRLGKDYEIHRYDGAFARFLLHHHTPMYRPEATMDAWGKIFTFFGDRLGTA